MRKNPHDRILKEKYKDQHLSLALNLILSKKFIKLIAEVAIHLLISKRIASLHL